MKLFFLCCQYLSQFHSSKDISLRKLYAVIRTELSHSVLPWRRPDGLNRQSGFNPKFPKPFKELLDPGPVQASCPHRKSKISR